MPSQSKMNGDEKAKVKAALSATSKIWMATVARIYYAYPDPQKWSYSGEQGGLAFVKDTQTGSLYFRLVDLQGTRGIVWEHELYEGFILFDDRPFFHSFAGDECMIGLVYTDESEAKQMLKVVKDKQKKASKAKATPAKKAKKSGSKIDKSLISAPQAGSFKHVSHMGYDSEKGFVSDGVDPSWLAFLTQLESHGVDKSIIAENMDFIKDFVRGAQTKAPSSAPKRVPPPAAQPKKKPPVPPPRRPGHAQQDSVGSIQSPVQEAPPAPPPPRVTVAPPPAPPTRPSAPPPPVRPSSTAPAAPPLPPPPPIRPSEPAHTAPPPPSRPSAAPVAPPPPPPGRPGASFAAPPPPPPPPPPGPAGAPPPPPPPPPGGPPATPAIAMPPAPAGRNALLESIQGKGIHALRKTAGPPEATGPGRVAGTSPSASPARATPPPPADDQGGGGGGGDLASALAAALTVRNKKLGDSDEEEDDEEEWD